MPTHAAAEVEVLLIDDDPAFRRVVDLALAREGHVLGQAPTGAAALGFLQAATRPPRLILLDLGLPDVVAGALLRALRRFRAGAHVPVIVVSGRTSIVEHAAAMEVDGFLRKPCELEALLALVDLYCRPGRTPASSLLHDLPDPGHPGWRPTRSHLP